MNRRKRAVKFALVSICLLALPGCSLLFPTTAEVVYPNTLEDLGMALLADLSQWLILLGL